MTRRRVWFGKALPGPGETARWTVKVGPTKASAQPVGYVVARRGQGRQSGAYWQAYALYGGLKVGRPVLTRKEAGDALALHHETIR